MAVFLGSGKKEFLDALLVLEDGSSFPCFSFGFPKGVSGEVVFNTGMVGYPESFTDPSYRGQILALTYPLIGNYGVPPAKETVFGSADAKLPLFFESPRMQLSGLVVSEFCEQPSHWNCAQTLAEWLNASKVPAVFGIDTRALTKKLRERGVMLGKILIGDDAKDPEKIPFDDPNKRNLAAEASIKEPVTYQPKNFKLQNSAPKISSSKNSKKTVALIDCGAKANIIRSLLARNVNVLRVPWDYELQNHAHEFDAVVVSNGPGDPKMAGAAIENLRALMELGKPIFGICLGNQLLALAAGADTYKLKYGHRSQNQPCVMQGTERCFITSQNHGYAVDEKKLLNGWNAWFRNLNDGTNEGIRHEKKPFMSVQFHPEAWPGPVDTGFLFDKFLEMVN